MPLLNHLHRIGFNFAQAKAKNVVFKLGRTTGPTVGTHNHCKAITRSYRSTEGPVKSWESVVLPPDDEVCPFATFGDSGALVYGPQGEGLGMVWGGLLAVGKKENGVHLGPSTLAIDRVVFVTPLQALFNSMKARIEREFGQGNIQLDWLR